MPKLPSENLPEEFYLWLIRSGKKPSTCRTRKYYLAVLLLTGAGGYLTLEIVEKIIVGKIEAGLKAGGINNFIVTARTFAQFCIEKGYPIDERLLSVRFMKSDTAEKSIMSDEEIEAFLSLPPMDKRYIKETAKWTVFFSIMAFSGARPGEVAKLTKEDIDFGRNVFILRDTKTRDNRYPPIAPNIELMVRAWVNECETDILFLSKRGSVFGTSLWNFNFQQRIKRLGIKRKNLTPYSLRHSFITRLLEEDTNLFKVQKIVGHKNTNTTAGYTHLTTKDTQMAIQRHPLIRKQTSPENIIKIIEAYVDSFELYKDFRFKLSKTVSNGHLTIDVSYSD